LEGEGGGVGGGVPHGYKPVTSLADRHETEGV